MLKRKSLLGWISPQQKRFNSSDFQRIRSNSICSFLRTPIFYLFFKLDKIHVSPFSCDPHFMISSARAKLTLMRMCPECGLLRFPKKAISLVISSWFPRFLEITKGFNCDFTYDFPDYVASRAAVLSAVALTGSPLYNYQNREKHPRDISSFVWFCICLMNSRCNNSRMSLKTNRWKYTCTSSR